MQEFVNCLEKENKVRCCSVETVEIEWPEVWKAISDYPGYFVSSKGRVWSKKLKRPMKPRARRHGYLCVKLGEGSKAKTFPVYHLVLEAFRGKRFPGMEAHHVNGNKSDNRLENLLWTTHSENIKHAYEDGRFKNRKARNNKIKMFPLIENEKWKVIKDYPEYLVSNHGRVWNRKKKRFIGTNGKSKVAFYRENEFIGSAFIHVLVLEAFVSLRPSPKHIGIHLDKNNLNNHFQNLKWISCSENLKQLWNSGKIKSSNKNKPRGEDAARAVLTEEQVKEIRNYYSNGMKVSKISKLYKLAYTTISAVCHNKTWAWLK